MESLPKEIHEILDIYFDQLEVKLPDLLHSFYLFGSASLGAYQDTFSDIDFLAILNRKLTHEEIKTIIHIHRFMQKKFPKSVLDGFYLLKDELISSKCCKKGCLRFNDGKFQGFTKFDTNSINGYQLKKYGVKVKGDSEDKIDFNVNWDILKKNMIENVNTYWRKWVLECSHFPSTRFFGLYLSHVMIEWGVLSISRIYYTLRENDIISKVEAGEYVLDIVPKEYHRIINEATRKRTGNKSSYYKSIFKRRKEALNYVEFMINECNKLF
jgi:hypothetical protein